MIIERAHRLSVPRKPNKHRPIIVKFLTYKDRSKVIEKGRDKLKDTDYGVSEDFPFEVRDTRRKLVPFMLRARDQGKKAFISYDKLLIEKQKFKYDVVNNDIVPV